MKLNRRVKKTKQSFIVSKQYIAKSSFLHYRTFSFRCFCETLRGRLRPVARREERGRSQTIADSWEEGKDLIWIGRNPTVFS